ncbi:hypothetical protein E2320_013532 [Naja naja]|nr:hypothetical protein E2320_013532 [Naja naja]
MEGKGIANLRQQVFKSISNVYFLSGDGMVECPEKCSNTEKLENEKLCEVSAVVALTDLLRELNDLSLFKARKMEAETPGHCSIEKFSSAKQLSDNKSGFLKQISYSNNGALNRQLYEGEERATMKQLFMSAIASQDFSQPDVEDISLVCGKAKAIMEQPFCYTEKTLGQQYLCQNKHIILPWTSISCEKGWSSGGGGEEEDEEEESIKMFSVNGNKNIQQYNKALMGEGIGNFLGSVCFCECPLLCVGIEVTPTWVLYKVPDINKYLVTVFSCCPQKDQVFHCMSNELSKREREREQITIQTEAFGANKY